MEIDTTPPSPTRMTSALAIPDREEREPIRRPQLTTPLNPTSNITSSSQTHLLTIVHPNVQAIDEAFVMANYSQLEPLMGKRMKELKLQVVATRFSYSSTRNEEDKEDAVT
ncbi:hypothetical protein Tco_1443602 [Tanacetum coccineum]